MASVAQHQTNMYLRYRPMVDKLACRMAPRAGHLRQDLIEAGHDLLTTRICQYSAEDRDKCSLSTWMYRNTWWAMKSHMRSLAKRRPPVSLSTAVPSRKSWLTQMLVDLSDEAATVVKIILSAPDEIAEQLQGRRSTARRVARQYLQQRGWDDNRIDRAWTEITECLCSTN